MNYHKNMEEQKIKLDWEKTAQVKHTRLVMNNTMCAIDLL